MTMEIIVWTIGFTTGIIGSILGRTGSWIRDGFKDGNWYFAADTGELQTGFLKINGNVYYMDANSCALFTGEKEYNGVTYTFTENGTIDGQPYIYTEWNSDGTLRRGTKFGYAS